MSPEAEGAVLPMTPGADARAREMLASGTPQEILARIVPEDALGLRARVHELARRHALLCDAEHVLLTAQALCALEGRRAASTPTLAHWLDERVSEAVALTHDEDCELGAEGAGALPATRDDAPPARELARACGRFNGLSFEQRDAFSALVLEPGGPDRAARRRGLSLSELARRARPALAVFLALAHEVEGPARTPVGGGAER
jgi:hypothetical protein